MEEYVCQRMNSINSGTMEYVLNSMVVGDKSLLELTSHTQFGEHIRECNLCKDEFQRAASELYDILSCLGSSGDLSRIRETGGIFGFEIP